MQQYRKDHFTVLYEYEINGRLKSPEWYRKEGRCPVTPEEVVLLLSAAGVHRSRGVFLVGGDGVFGGARRLAAIRSLFPRSFTLRDVLSSAELAPFGDSIQKVGERAYLSSLQW